METAWAHSGTVLASRGGDAGGNRVGQFALKIEF